MKKINLITASFIALGLTACSSEQSVSTTALTQISAPGAPVLSHFGLIQVKQVLAHPMSNIKRVIMMIQLRLVKCQKCGFQLPKA